MTEKPPVTPTEDLLLEVLVARWREGWALWTFDRRWRRQLESLSTKGYVSEKSGIVERTWLAWLTPAGREWCLSPTYSPPVPGEMWARDPDDGHLSGALIDVETI